MKLKKNICEDCCKGKRISELDEKVDIQGTEYIPFQEGDDNGKFSLGSLKDYLIKLVEEYLINNGIIREDWVQSEPAYKLLATLPELIADRACKDEFGNNINDTYLTRKSVKEYIGSIFEDLFTENPPKILDGYITVDMLSDAVLQLLNSGGAITNFPDDEDLTVKDGKLKFKDKVYDPNNYSGMGRTILRKNMVDGVNVLTQEMMSEPNVIYVIQYDYDLRGETIVVPDNSILWYLGGSLNNGHITSYDEDRLIIWGNLNGDIEIDIDVSLVGAPADEEDITTESGVLKFKDKEYDTASFSGLGRKYLRKNIVNGKNILTQEMINSANTRYIIQYDYDLNEETITVPEGCVLQFKGGSLSNGTISGINTLIESPSSVIFTEISLTGNFVNSRIESIWFGVTDGTDCSKTLQSAINNTVSSGVRKLLFNKGTYYLSSSITIPSRFDFGGEVIDSLSVWNYERPTIYLTESIPAFTSEDEQGVRYLSIHDITIYGTNVDNKENLYAFHFKNSIYVSNNTFKNLWVHRCKFGFYFEVNNYAGVSQNVFDNVSLYENKIGIYIKGEADTQNRYPWLNQNIIRNCYINNNSIGGILTEHMGSVQDLSIYSCNFEHNGTNEDEDDYKQYGNFAIHFHYVKMGVVTINNCYFEDNLAKKSDGSPYDYINKEKEATIITGSVSLNIFGNIIAATRQFILTDTSASRIYLQGNDYYLSTTSETHSNSLVRYIRINVSQDTSLVIKEGRMINAPAISKAYEFLNSDLSSGTTFYSSFIDIDCPNFEREVYRRRLYDDNSTFYINSEIGNPNYTGLSASHPFSSLNDITYYGLSRYSKVNVINIELQSDTVFSRQYNFSDIANITININGNGHKLTIKASSLFRCTNVSLTINDCDIEVENNNQWYYFLYGEGTCRVLFNNCNINFIGSSTYYFIQCRPMSIMNITFLNSTFSSINPDADIWVTNVMYDGYVLLDDVDLEYDRIYKVVANNKISSAVVHNNHNYNNLGLSRTEDSNSFVYTDDDCVWHNIDGTLVTKVVFI